MKKIISKMAVIVVFVSCCAGNLFAEGNQTKIAVVYLKKTFDSYQKTVEYDKQLSKQTEELEKKKKQLKGEVDKLKASIELLSDKEKAEKIRDLRKKELELRKYVLDEMKKIGKERDAYLKEILKDIKPVISAYAKENGLDIVLNGDTILYAKDMLDITDTVVAKLNEEYKKK